MADRKDDPKNNPEKKPPPKSENDLHRAEETLGDAPSGGPNADERSRLAD